jgi:tetratricopeptide (TPR) repeat protein
MQQQEKLAELTHMGWTLLEEGRFRDALPVLERAYEAHRAPGSLNNVALAMLCMQDYDAAYETFMNVLENSPYKSDYEWTYVGVCQWCRSKPMAAIDTWKKGIGVKYTDAAGGLTIPLVLIFAGTVLAEESLRDLATREITARLEGFRNNWPAPLGEYMLGTISYSDVAERISTYSAVLQEKRRPLLEFYRAVQLLRDGESSSYVDTLRRVTSTIHHRIFPEWFLARHELQQRSSVRNQV